MLRTVLAAVALAAAFALVGCGDDDETTTTTSGPPPATLSAEDFATQANAVCAAANQEIERAAGDLGQNPSQEEVDAFVASILVPLTQGQVDAIRALPAPADIQEDVNAVLDDVEAVLGELEADPSLIDDDPFAEVGERAEELGLTECGG